MTDKATVCCFRVRRKRFCIASMIAFAVMIVSAILIVTIAGTSDIGHTIVFILMDFSVVVIFLLIFGALDEFCCAPENPSPTKGNISKFNKNRSSQNDMGSSTYPMDAACIANSANGAADSGFSDLSYSADPSCSVDVSGYTDTSCSAVDTSCSAADTSCSAGDTSCD